MLSVGWIFALPWVGFSLFMQRDRARRIEEYALGSTISGWELRGGDWVVYFVEQRFNGYKSASAITAGVNITP
jgi:hypothetical protein